MALYSCRKLRGELAGMPKSRSSMPAIAVDFPASFSPSTIWKSGCARRQGDGCVGEVTVAEQIKLSDAHDYTFSAASRAREIRAGMRDQACDVAVDGGFQHRILRIRADVVGQFADEIAEIGRELRLQARHRCRRCSIMRCRSPNASLREAAASGLSVAMTRRSIHAASSPRPRAAALASARR